MTCGYEGKLSAFLVLGVAVCWALAPVVAIAKVQVLSETVLKVDGKRSRARNG